MNGLVQVKGWLDRVLLSLGGALVGAGFIAFLEAVRASRAWRAPVRALLFGDGAVLVPVATAIGFAVAVLGGVLDPDHRRSVQEVLRGMRALDDSGRARWAAAALIVPTAVLAWMLACAHEARSALEQEAPTVVVGTWMAAASLVALVLTAAAVIAALPLAARTVTARLDPLIAGAWGASFAVVLVLLGLRLGDASGNGPTPFAILGVLTREELDVTPVVAIAFIVLCALVGERTSWDPRPTRLALAAAGIAAGWILVVRQAYALSEDAQVARAIELGAPLGRVGLAVARRATDRDHDGYSALFGGGDCDDSDPRRSPNAIDIPGNGIDEDCSGSDLPLPRQQAPLRRAPRNSIPQGLSLVLITVDTLRIDLGFMGYKRPVSPNLDALAARSTVFERAYSMASYTGKSLGPTLIGKYPSETFRDFAHFDTYLPSNTFLAERLKEAGFHTMGVVSHWYFKPRYGLSQGMDIWDMSAMPPDSGGDTDSSVTSNKLTDAAIRLLSDPENVRSRFFLWVHYFDPHANYVPHPEAPDFRPGATNWSKPLYDGEVWFTDYHLGRLFDFIRSQAWGTKTAIIVTSDHGEAFEEHGMSWHGVNLWEPLVRVPLIVYVPGVKPHRVKAKRSNIDLVPTALDLLGVAQPPQGELSGESNAAVIVAPDEVGIDERDVLMDMPAGTRVSRHRALLHGPSPGIKLMAEGGAVYLVFDLVRDPGELNDLSRDRPTLRTMMNAFDEKLSSLHEVRAEPAQ